MRRELRLLDPSQEDFALGDLGGRVEGLHVRFVVIPSDPDSRLVRFDDEFWEWWRANQPRKNGRTPWGSKASATPWAATWNDPARDDGAWDGYFGLRRNGSLDAGVGKWSVFLFNAADATVRGFRLLATVGRIHLALETYSRAV